MSEEDENEDYLKYYTESTVDEVFGEILLSEHYFEKIKKDKQEITLFGKSYKVDVRIYQINDNEREFYKVFQEVLDAEQENIVKKIKEVLKRYFKEDKGEESTTSLVSNIVKKIKKSIKALL